MRNLNKIFITVLSTMIIMIGSLFLPWIMIAIFPIFTIFGAGPVALFYVFTSLAERESNIGHKRMLVVDDDAVALIYLKRAFDAMGFETVVFDSPLQALSTIKGEKFDYAVVDQVMPELSGEDFVMRLDAQYGAEGYQSKPNVLMFTGHPEGVHINRHLLHNVNYKGVISKNGAKFSNLSRVFSKGLGALN